MTRSALPVIAAALLAACTSGPSGPSITMPTTATHGAMFPIGPGDVHGAAPGAVVDCNACHKDKLTGLPSESFRTFTCTGCHVAAPGVMHDDVAALTAFHQASAAVAAAATRLGQPFDTQDRACRACHPSGIRDAVDHALHLPLPHGDKAGIVVARCADCHVARASGNYLVMGCASCHPHDDAATAARHAAVPDFVPLPAAPTQAERDAASAACVRCHGDGVAPATVAGHAALAQGFPIGAAAVHAGASSACLTCHPALRADPNKPLAADFKVVSCTGCHTALVGATNLPHDDRAQLQAYHLALTDSTTTPPTPIAKARLFAQVVDAAVTAAGGDAARGLSAACLQCHPQGIGSHPYYLLPHQNAAHTVVATCAQCHVDAARRSDLGCAACHATSSPVAARHAKVPDVVASDTSLAASARCARCHENDAIPARVATHGPFAIATGKHAGAAGGACLACHPAQKPEPTPWAADFKQVSCVGCHVAVAGGRAQHDDWAGLAPIHAGVALFPATAPTPAAFSAACLGCHPTGTSGVPADHGEWFGLAAGSNHVFPGPRITACLDCHTSADRKNPADFRCAACHAADATPLATGHAGVPDFAADPQNPVKCLACHANGARPGPSTGGVVSVAGHSVASGGFVVGAGAHAGAGGGACLTCHPVNRVPSATAPHWDYARDWKQVGCTGCHVTVASGAAFHDSQAGLGTLHAAVTNFTSTVASMGLGGACLYCHPTGGAGAPASHPALFPIAVGSKHAGLSCSQCHTNPANRRDLTALACASCHATTSTNGKTLAAAHAITGYTITSYQTATTAGGTQTTVSVSMTTSQSCLRCHAASHVDRVALHPLGDAGFGTGRHLTAGCLTCHSRFRTDQPWAAQFGEAQGTAGPPPTGCFVCHASGSG